MPWIPAAIGAAGAIGGALIGRDSNRSAQRAARDAQARADAWLSNVGEREQMGRDIEADQLKQLQGLISSGPGSSDVEGGVNSQRNLAALFERMSETGAIPTQADNERGQRLAQEQFRPQQVALDQSLRSSERDTARLAGQLGRSQDDPILRTKLAQLRMEGTERLQAGQQSLASQISQQSPLDRLNFAQQGAALRGGLASQALQNRQALLSLGSGIVTREQNFRATAAGRGATGNQAAQVNPLAAGMAGASAGLDLFSAIKKLSGGSTGSSNIASFSGSTGTAGLSSTPQMFPTNGL